MFLADRRPVRAVATADLCPVTGRARLSYRRAEKVFEYVTRALTNASASTVGLAGLRGWTLHQLRHSRLAHEAGAGTNTPALLTISRHASVRSLERYARPGMDAVSAHIAATDRAPDDGADQERNASSTMSKKRPRPATTASDPIADILAQADDPARPAAARLLAAATDDPSDPVHAIRLPTLIIDAIAEHFGLPDGRCVDDCLILAHAFAQLGIAAQVRAAVLTVRDRAAGLGVTYGSLIPEWENGLLNGHAALWLPQVGLIVDANAEQYEEVALAGCGPVIIPGQDIASDRITGRASLGPLSLRYTLAPASATPVLLGHPAAHEVDPRRHGPNIAASAVLLLAHFTLETDTTLIPHLRIAALVHAVRGMRREDNEHGDIRFRNADVPAGTTTLRLDQLPLPDTIPPPLPVEM